MSSPIDASVLAEALSRYGFDPASCKHLGGFESQVFEAQGKDGATILKLGDPEHRSVSTVQAECEWLDFLFRQGLSVAPAIRTLDGTFAIGLTDAKGKAYCARAFVKAPGEIISAQTVTMETVGTWGELIGKLHVATKEYVPPSPNRRHRWDEDSDFAKGWTYLPEAEQEPIGGRFRRHLDALRALPTGKDVFGLVHTDAHFTNLLQSGDRLTLIDFDDCAYEWFSSDLGIVLFYAAVDPLGEYPADFYPRFREAFLNGYAKAHVLPEHWLKGIERFMKIREFILYIALHRIGKEETLDEWCTTYIQQHRDRLLNDVPVWP